MSDDTTNQQQDQGGGGEWEPLPDHQILEFCAGAAEMILNQMACLNDENESERERAKRRIAQVATDIMNAASKEPPEEEDRQPWAVNNPCQYPLNNCRIRCYDNCRKPPDQGHTYCQARLEDCYTFNGLYSFAAMNSLH